MLSDAPAEELVEGSQSHESPSCAIHSANDLEIGPWFGFPLTLTMVLGAVMNMECESQWCLAGKRPE